MKKFTARQKLSPVLANPMKAMAGADMFRVEPLVPHAIDYRHHIQEKR